MPRQTDLFGTFLDTMAAHAKTQQFRSFSGEIVAVPPANPKALAIYYALKACMAAEAEVARIAANLPDYMPTASPIDFYGPQLVAFHECVNKLGEEMGL